MTNGFVRALCVAALCLGMPRPAAAETPAQSAQLWPQDVSDIAPDPAVTWGVLPNGLRYAVMKHSEPPGRASLRLYVNSGSLMETEKEQGLAHFLEHMAFNGTTHHAHGTMVEYFQRLGMGFGNDTNAHTSWDETVYKLELPKVDDAMLDDTMQMLRDYADGMLLEQKDIDDERGIILAEKRDRDSVKYRLFVDSFKFTLPECLPSSRFPIGEESVIQNATRDDFLSFYRGWYTPDRMIVAVVGDIEPARAVGFITKYFGDMPVNAAPRSFPDMGTIVPRGVVARVKIESEASSVDISIATARRLADLPDSKALRADALARDVANAVIGRRLEILSRKSDAPFTQGASYTFHIWNFVDTSEIDLSCPPEKWTEALALAETELRRALEHGFTGAEVSEAVANLRNGYEESVRRAPTEKNWNLVDSMLSALGDRAVFTSPQQDLDLAAPVLDAMTPDIALTALRKAWEGDTRIIWVGGNLPAGADDAAALATWRASAAKPVEPPQASETAAFAYRDFGTPGKVADAHVLMDLDITQLRFANNVFVNIKQTDFEKNVVRVMVRFGSGMLELPKDNPGVGLVAGMTFTSGGLRAHSADDIARIFAGKNVGVTFSPSTDSFVLSGKTTPRDLQDELNLITACITAPGYRDEALVQARRQLPEIYRMAANTADGVLQDRVDSFLAVGDHRFGLPSQADAEKIDMDAVRAWLSGPLATSRMEVSIVGDIDPSDAIPMIARTFGALPQREEFKSIPDARRSVSLPPAGEKTFAYASELPKAVSMMVWPTADTWDVSRSRRLMVLADILSDRLRVELREKLGEAYSPYAFNKGSDTYTGYGYTACICELSPDKVPEVAALVRKVAGDIAAKGVTQDELDRALKPIEASVTEWRRNNKYWIGMVLASSQEY
ncbi:MAG TPA: insulinase family protein, partial [Opitutales bacterium]|nr:insulinase family protein [Opitutales bacterium]